jgi:nucleotide-binding universal stress UspA family protein
MKTVDAIESVLHPTDFSEASLTAFYHALKAALLTKSKLTLLNVCEDGEPPWSDFPGIRETLERWKLLPPNSPKSAVGELGVRAAKIVARNRDPVKAVLGFLEHEPVDLIVLSASNRKGRARWLGSSVSEPLAHTAWQTTLFIPANCRGFIDPEDGSVDLKRVLIPIAQSPRAQPAIDAAHRLVKRLNCPAGTFILMHVGTNQSMPAVRCPEVAGWKWEKQLTSGEVIQSIVATAKQVDTDVIVMSTDGRNEFLDALRGSHSERVLRHGVAPLLTVPVGALAATDPHLEDDD